jgi:hypothetical protein
MKSKNHKNGNETPQNFDKHTCKSEFSSFLVPKVFGYWDVCENNDTEKWAPSFCWRVAPSWTTTSRTGCVASCWAGTNYCSRVVSKLSPHNNGIACGEIICDVYV